MEHPPPAADRQAAWSTALTVPIAARIPDALAPDGTAHRQGNPYGRVLLDCRRDDPLHPGWLPAPTAPTNRGRRDRRAFRNRGLRLQQPGLSARPPGRGARCASWIRHGYLPAGLAQSTKFLFWAERFFLSAWPQPALRARSAHRTRDQGTYRPGPLGTSIGPFGSVPGEAGAAKVMASSKWYSKGSSRWTHGCASSDSS